MNVIPLPVSLQEKDLIPFIPSDDHFLTSESSLPPISTSFPSSDFPSVASLIFNRLPTPPVLSTETGLYRIIPKPLVDFTGKPWVLFRAISLHDRFSSFVVKIGLNSPYLRETFLHEVKQASFFGFWECKRLIPPIDFQLDPTGSLIFLVFPDRGLNASDFITKQLKTSVNLIVSLLSDVCEALLFLHHRGFCHRDVKLENICIFHGRAYLIDLEMVREIGLRYTGVVGTLGYLSREMLDKRSEHVVEEANDVFAFGMMALQLCAGECLLWYRDIGFIRPFELLRRVPEELQDWFTRMFDENPACRPKMIDLAAEFDAFLRPMDGRV
jgi:hypothetical protein